MKPLSKDLKPPIVGAGIEMDDDVFLNVKTGRRIKTQSPLKLGSHARLRSGSVLYAHSQIGNDFETGHHVIVREENQIGNHVSIWNNTTIDYGCQIGNRVKIHCNCYIAQYSILEDDVFLAPGVIFANDLFPGASQSARCLQGPILRRGAKIGVNCTLLPGVEIGAGAIVGAGSVVTRDIPAGAVAWGNPARPHKSRSSLMWPENFPIQRSDAARFYKKSVAARNAFPKNG